MAKKKARVRLNPSIRLDGAWVNSETLVTKNWTEVSPTLAKKLVVLEYKGLPKFEVEEGDPDEGDPEAEELESTEEAE